MGGPDCLRSGKTMKEDFHGALGTSAPVIQWKKSISWENTTWVCHSDSLTVQEHLSKLSSSNKSQCFIGVNKGIGQ